LAKGHGSRDVSVPDSEERLWGLLEELIGIVLEAVCVLAGDKLHHGVSIKARVLSGVKPGMVVSGSYRSRAQRGCCKAV
jgi:hypothetical protein